ncbi:Helix-turn-helix domain protein [Actinokineospora sp. UTMC 2448]|nr:helix-turn-helix domain-containing protein [Actinokineospora sp. UTMC 2448]UVS81707.1 Helix-turn-helix domain protein [Actinokineospora sp. UTMC 2448]
MSGKPTDHLWTVGDVSEYLRVPVQTLYQWRTKNYGPCALRVGKYLRYREDDVRRWVAGLGEAEAA